MLAYLIPSLSKCTFCSNVLSLKDKNPKSKSRLLWTVDYEKPMRTGHKEGKMQLNSFFLRCLSVGQDWHNL
jgi:hypothetical protein